MTKIYFKNITIMESWGSNLSGILGINRERRDCLSVGAFPIYGNGRPLINIFFTKGARMFSSLVTQQSKIKLDPN